MLRAVGLRRCPLSHRSSNVSFLRKSEEEDWEEPLEKKKKFTRRFETDEDDGVERPPGEELIVPWSNKFKIGKPPKDNRPPPPSPPFYGGPHNQYAPWEREDFTGESGSGIYEPGFYKDANPREILAAHDLRAPVSVEVMEKRIRLEREDFLKNAIWDLDPDEIDYGKGDEEDFFDKTVLGSFRLPKDRERKVDAQGRAHGYGGRKTSKASVIITENSEDSKISTFEINNKYASERLTFRELVEYFRAFHHRETVLHPLLITELLGNFNVSATVSGGGVTGQVGALRMALARAVENWDPEYRYVLKRAGYLERDQRVVERKKFGQAKARRKFQWVKR